MLGTLLAEPLTVLSDAISTTNISTCHFKILLFEKQLPVPDQTGRQDTTSTVVPESGPGNTGLAPDTVTGDISIDLSSSDR